MTDDEYFGPAFVDVDEWRDGPVRHRYLHGGFEGTDTRFSAYLPPKEQYQGRFLQLLSGGTGGTEHAAMTSPNAIPFAFANGAYLVESNQGHMAVPQPGFSGTGGSSTEIPPSVLTYRASAHTARWARRVASEMYGEAPHHGYVYGGSGGGYRSLLCAENVDDVWDGAVPFVSGWVEWARWRGPEGPIFLAPFFCNAVRALGPKVAQVIDAFEPGGSRRPFDGLDTEQREALAALLRAGWPEGAEFVLGYPTLDWMFYTPGAVTTEYVDAFWSTPGYAGADGMLDHALVDSEKVTVARVVSANELPPEALGFGTALAGNQPIGIAVDSQEARRFLGATIRVASGAAEGRELLCTGVNADVLMPFALFLPGMPGPLADIQPGDELVIDNHTFLAFCHISRYHINEVAPYTEQFTVDGQSIYPVGAPGEVAPGLSVDATGKFNGKMIMVNAAQDTLVPPLHGTTYRRMVNQELGDRTDDRFRMWITEHAYHAGPAMMGRGPSPVMETRLIDYTGSVEHALRSMIDWVENSIAPAASTAFSPVDRSLNLGATAAERLGIQPVVVARANGGVAAQARVGEAVNLEVDIEVPPGAGGIIAVEWDFDGSGSWPFRHDNIDGAPPKATLSTTHTFSDPGTYFPAVRVTSHRDGDAATTSCRVMNLGRVRVVVE